MRVRRLTFENSRGSLGGSVHFGAGHTLLVGGNNVGNSTVCKALDLVLGPERLARRPVIDEHDFLCGKYVEYRHDDEWDRLRKAAASLEGRSPHLLDKMVLARHTRLRRSNLFRAQWTWVDWLNRVVRVPRTKNNLAHAVPLNDTAHVTLKRLYAEGDAARQPLHLRARPQRQACWQTRA